MDLYTREIVGWHISNTHTKFLVMEAFLDALVNQQMQRPQVIHSDQGCEYTSQDYTNSWKTLVLTVSMSTKASPWENGFKNHSSTISKQILGLEFDRFESTGHLAEAIITRFHDYKRAQNSHDIEDVTRTNSDCVLRVVEKLLKNGGLDNEKMLKFLI